MRHIDFEQNCRSTREYYACQLFACSVENYRCVFRMLEVEKKICFIDLRAELFIDQQFCNALMTCDVTLTAVLSNVTEYEKYCRNYTSTYRARLNVWTITTGKRVCPTALPGGSYLYQRTFERTSILVQSFLELMIISKAGC